MSEYQQFIAEQSKTLLGHLLQGAVATGKVKDTEDVKAYANLAVLSAKALYERLEQEGAV